MANWDNIKGLLDHKHTASEIIDLNLISAGLDFQGVYNPLTTYTAAQYVQYNGSIYVSTIETTGNLPTNTNYWTLFISKGDKGEEGTPGSNGINGLDAYQIALNNGFEGTVTDWLDSLHGTNGINGTNGTNGTNGVDGEDGLSAYQIAVNNGFVGDVSAWLNSLKGANGNDGDTGPQGISAYQSSANGAFVENLRATDYSSSTITITLGTNLLFASTGVTSTGNDSGVYPDKAIRDCIETPSNAEGLVTISGLTPGVQYKFKIHGGRQYLDDTTRYTIQVDGSSDTTILTLNTKNNTLNTVETPYLTAGSTGIVTIKLKNTITNKAYLNVLEIREKL